LDQTSARSFLFFFSLLTKAAVGAEVWLSQAQLLATLGKFDFRVNNTALINAPKNIALAYLCQGLLKPDVRRLPFPLLIGAVAKLMQAYPKAFVVYPPVQVALAGLRNRLVEPAGCSL
jgi:hypothetical protein